MNYEIKIVRTDELSVKQRDQIIALKQQRWNYPYKSQLDWLEKNHLNDDEHLLVLDGDELIAYLYIARVPLSIVGDSSTALGIGNVCTALAYGGKGIGKLCVCVANKRIVERGKTGIFPFPGGAKWGTVFACQKSGQTAWE